MVFDWEITIGTANDTARVEVRRHPWPSIVNLPPHFDAAIKANGLPALAEASAKAYNAAHPASRVDIEVLGVIKPGCDRPAGFYADKTSLLQDFEPNPLLWPAPIGRASQRQVAALWTMEADSPSSHWVSYVHLNHLLSGKRRWPQPPAMRSSNHDAALHAKADRTTKERMVLCRWLVNFGDDKKYATFEFDSVFEDVTLTVPYRVIMRIDHARAVDRPIAGHPLDIVYPESCKGQLADRPRPTKLFFAPTFFDNVAALMTPPLMYWGTAVPTDWFAEPTIIHATPEGANPLDATVYWLWPAGHCLEMPTRTLAAASPTELRRLAKNRHTRWRITYKDVAAKLGYRCLGHIDREELDVFFQDMGTVGGQEWAALHGIVPLQHVSPCWWLTNPADDDESPSLVNKSLAQLHCEMGYRKELKNYESMGGDDQLKAHGGNLDRSLLDKSCSLAELQLEGRMRKAEENRRLAAENEECMLRDIGVQHFKNFWHAFRSFPETAFATPDTLKTAMAESEALRGAFEREFANYFALTRVYQHGCPGPENWELVLNPPVLEHDFLKLCCLARAGTVEEKRLAAIELEEISNTFEIHQERFYDHPFFDDFFNTFGKRSMTADEVLNRLGHGELMDADSDFRSKITSKFPTWNRDAHGFATCFSLCSQTYDPKGTHCTTVQRYDAFTELHHAHASPKAWRRGVGKAPVLEPDGPAAIAGCGTVWEDESGGDTYTDSDTDSPKQVDLAEANDRFKNPFPLPKPVAQMAPALRADLQAALLASNKSPDDMAQIVARLPNAIAVALEDEFEHWPPWQRTPLDPEHVRVMHPGHTDSLHGCLNHLLNNIKHHQELEEFRNTIRIAKAAKATQQTADCPLTSGGTSAAGHRSCELEATSENHNASGFGGGNGANKLVDQGDGAGGELVEEGPHGIVPDASHASIDSENDSLHKASSSDADMPSTEGDAESSFDIDLVDVPACIEKTNKYTSVRSHTF